MKNARAKLVLLTLALSANVAGAAAIGATGIDPAAIAGDGVLVVTAVGTAGAALILAGNGLKLAVKWVKRMVGFA